MSLQPIPTPPSLPRPPQADIDAVYPDLAKVLAALPVDAAGHGSAPVDEIIKELEGKAHSTAAIKWAIFIGQEQGWLVETTCQRDRRTSNPRTGVTTTRENMVEVPAIAATDAFWDAWELGRFQTRTKRIVILIHGIRTHANWQPMVSRVLQEIPETRVIPLKYGYFDAFRFWCPLFTRKAPIEDIWREIQNARNENPEAEVSVIAHSFGTYIISQILLENPYLHLKHLVLSGCIIPRQYRWDYVKARIKTTVVNDYGTRDIWPVLAQSLSWGYGDTGRHGFGRGAAITDRGHDYSHSDFFNEAFVRKFWHPWFDREEYVASAWDEAAPPSPWWLSILSILPLQWILVVAVAFGVYCYRTPDSNPVRPPIVVPVNPHPIDKAPLIALVSDSKEDFMARSYALSELLSHTDSTFDVAIPLIRQILWETPEDISKRDAGLKLIENALVPLLPEHFRPIVEEYGRKRELQHQVLQLLVDGREMGRFELYPEGRVLEVTEPGKASSQLLGIMHFWERAVHRAFQEASWERFSGFDDYQWTGQVLETMAGNFGLVGFIGTDEQSRRRMCNDPRIGMSVLGALHVLSGVGQSKPPDIDLTTQCERILTSVIDPSEGDDSTYWFAAKVLDLSAGNERIVDLALRTILDEKGFRNRWKGEAARLNGGRPGEMDRFDASVGYLKRWGSASAFAESVERRLCDFIQSRTAEIQEKRDRDVSFTVNTLGDERILACLDIIFVMNKFNFPPEKRHRLDLRLAPTTISAVDAIFAIKSDLQVNLSYHQRRWEELKSASSAP